MEFRLLYPERRTVSAETILGWYADRVADGDIDGPENPLAVDPVFAAHMLADAGYITVAR